MGHSAVVVVKIVLMLCMAVSAVAFGWLAHLSRHGRIKRNDWAGYRTATTMTSDDTWEAAHRAAWGWTVLGSVYSAVTAVGILLAATDTAVLIWTGIGAVLLGVCAIGGGLRAQRAAKEILRDRS